MGANAQGIGFRYISDMSDFISDYRLYALRLTHPARSMVQFFIDTDERVRLAFDLELARTNHLL